MPRIALISVIFLLCSPASAEFVDGNQALELCRKDRAWCIGYAAGATDALLTVLADEEFSFCLPPGITVGQTVDLLVRC